MFKKFEWKLSVVFLSLFLTVQGLVLTAVYITTKENVSDQAKRQLAFSGEVLTRNLYRQREDLIKEVQILSRDFGFTSAIASDDAATIVSALENLSARIEGHHATLIPIESEEVLTSVFGQKAILSQEVLQNLTYDAELNGSASTLAIIGDQIHEIVVVPVLAPIPIAWILLSRPVTHQVARDLKDLLDRDVEVTFVTRRNDGEWSSHASTLTSDLSFSLSDQL